jgi:adenosylhomocysteine nucleosidase
MRTVLLVAAEAREFSGILKRAPAKKLEWSEAVFSREVAWKNDRWLLVANGPGAQLVGRLLARKRDVDLILSVGFCGALDPALRVGDIVNAANVLTADRVAVTAAEKHALRERTGAAAVEMEASAVEAKAREWGTPFHAVKVVSDTAAEDLPLDFNQYRDSDGRFSRARIALAALRRPSALAGLMRLDRNCRRAADELGEFLAHTSI